MKARCAPNGNYAKLGISVCEEWRKDFMAFYNYMGPRPSLKHSLDRYPNAKGNYEPGNVRWATSKEQGWSKVGRPQSETSNKKRSLSLRGAGNGVSKLTEEDVREIRASYQKQSPKKEKSRVIKELAARFGISLWHVRAIQHKRAWSWLE
jgi:hypothetical protein